MTEATPWEPRLEALMDRLMIQWVREPAYDLAAIDWKASNDFQIRFDRVTDPEWEAVLFERYAEGETLPAVVLANNRLVCGRHRTPAAIRANRRSLPAYLVVGAETDLEALAVASNTSGPRPLSRVEQIRYGIHLHADRGRTIADAAGLVGLTHTALRNAIAVDAADERARTLGVTRGWKKLTSSHKKTIATLPDVAFREVAQLVIDSDLSTPETSALCAKVRKTRSERAAAQEVAEFRQQVIHGRASQIPAKPAVAAMTPERRLRLVLANLLSIDLDAFSAITDSDRQQLEPMVDKAGAYLVHLLSLFRA